ncbi:MAG: CDP-alcohol phosphatidyltransferase family protein [Acidobacteriota bacterium]
MNSGRLITWANGITIVRFIFFLCFVGFLFTGQTRLAVTLFTLAWALDAVDGYIARRLHLETALGSFLDKIVDRVLIGFGLLCLIVTGYLPDYSILILTKDIGLLPVLTIHLARQEYPVPAGWRGKAMTALQGVAILWLLFRWPYPEIVVGITAALGGMAAIVHLRNVAS